MINNPKSLEERRKAEDKRIDEYVKADKWKEEEEEEEDSKDSKEGDNEAGK